MLSLAYRYIARNGLETLGELFQKTNFEVRYPDTISSTTLAASGSGMEKSGCGETMMMVKSYCIPGYRQMAPAIFGYY